MDDQNKSGDKEKLKAKSSQVVTLRSLLNAKIKHYTIKRNRNKTGAFIVQGASILFSFGTTVLIGWKLKDSNSDDQIDITNAALFLSAMATGIITLDKFFDYKDLWVGYNVSISKLKLGLSKLDFLESLGVENINQEDIDTIYEIYENVCKNMDKNYQDIRSQRDE